MNVQYISDSDGEMIGVFVPIEVWNRLINSDKELAQEVSNPSHKWHEEVIQGRLEEYKNTGEAYDWDDVINDIEKNL